MSSSRLARLLALPGLLLLLLGASPAAAATRPSPNLLGNPGFEDPLPGHPWMPAKWDTSASGLISVFFGRDTFLVHGGRYAISVANLSTLFYMAHNWSQGFIVDKDWWGKDAVFSVWTRTNGLQGQAFVRAVIYRDSLSKMGKIWGVSRQQAGDSLNIKTVDDPTLEMGWQYAHFSEAETEWVRREVRLYIPPSTNWLRLSLGLTGTGQVIFDDASLTLEPALPPPVRALHENLLADPGFEGNGDAWEFSVGPFPDFKVARDTTLSHSGRACIHFEDKGGGLNRVSTGVCQPIVDRGLSGKRVRISAWLKTDSLQGLANVAIYYKSQTGSDHPVPTLYSNTQDWTLVSLEGDVPPDTYEVWAWFMYQAPAPGKVYFDDCAFEVIGDAAQPPPPPKAASKPKPPPADKHGGKPH
jgi:hypothetical protein